MRRIIWVMAVMAASAIPAFAAEGKGPGNCIVSGTLFSQIAKLDDSPKDLGLPPGAFGQAVKEQCTLAGS